MTYQHDVGQEHGETDGEGGHVVNQGRSFVVNAGTKHHVRENSSAEYFHEDHLQWRRQRRNKKNAPDLR